MADEVEGDSETESNPGSVHHKDPFSHMDIDTPGVTAQSIVERGRDNRWCETRSIGSLKYKNLKLREKGRKEKWCRSEGCF